MRGGEREAVEVSCCRLVDGDANERKTDECIAFCSCISRGETRFVFAAPTPSYESGGMQKDYFIALFGLLKWSVTLVSIGQKSVPVQGCIRAVLPFGT